MELDKIQGGNVKHLLEVAMDQANLLGADYADIRIQKTRREFIFLRNLSLKNTSNSQTHGYGIRVFKNGAWGFAHSSEFSAEAVKKTVAKAYEIARQSRRVPYGKGLELATERAYIDTYRSPVTIDPFSVDLNDKIDLMLEVNKTLLNYEPIKLATFMFEAQKDEKLFASTLGSRLDIGTTYVCPVFTANAVGNNDSQSRSFNLGGFAAGWEYVLGLNLLQEAPRVAEEAIMKLSADVISEEKRRDLLLDPIHLGLTMHESVGHPTELDRVLGWEADFAGISFATPEKLKTYQYGSKIVNFLGDNTLAGGLATAGYDDDGVPNQKWYIVKDGILNEYGTTRDTAPILGLQMSRGCNRATNYYDFPINRIPNLYLEPGKEPLTPQELISDTEDAIYIEGQGSFSIDQHRVNFQFGGDMFWEIKNGKKTKMLKKVIYRSNNPEFWNSVDAICDARFFRTFGVNNCGKGQPGQRGRMTHGGSLTRFRNITVGGSK
ncbi:MAG: TldD/PmbA family protein [Candidatus Cloacimonetes bacterium]|nr:TldD/PmbA family protein [Candidatus Cloacimonadota bacterium]